MIVLPNHARLDLFFDLSNGVRFKLKRLFFALWPDDITRQRCVSIVNSIGIQSLKPVHANNIHVTLKFLGNLSIEKEVFLKAQAATIPIPEINIEFDCLSFWKPPGILCLTSSLISPELTVFVNNMSELASKLDIKNDDRPFKPHITLLKNAKKLTTVEFEPIHWRSNAFCLVESRSIRGVVAYEVVQQWEL